HGSPTLIALLVRETEARSGRLNFTRSFSACQTAWLAGIAGAALLVAILPAFFIGDRYADFGKRLVTSWSPPAGTEVVAVVERPEDKLLAAGAKFDIKVQPGDKYVATYEELIVTAPVT